MARPDDDDFEDDRPRKPRRRRDDDEDDDLDEAPRKPRRRVSANDDVDEPLKTKSKSKLPMILGIVAGVLLLFCCLGGGGVYYAYTKFALSRDRVYATNNAKQIGLGLHNYHDTYAGLPHDSTDLNGKPLLSWRVHLLPFIEQGALYRQFRLNEPWDSPHNKALLSQMPAVYATPKQRNTGKLSSGMTYVQAFKMPGAALVRPAERGKMMVIGMAPAGVRLNEVIDGNSNTFFFVEAATPVEWTKPDDINWAPGQPVPAFGADREDSTFIACMADGSVRSISKSISPESLKAGITINGKEPPPIFP